MKQWRVTPGFEIVEIYGEYYLAAGKAARKKFPAIQYLNEIGAIIWKGLAAGTKPEKIAASITETYEIGYEQAMSDVDAFCSDLCKKGYLISSV